VQSAKTSISNHHSLNDLKWCFQHYVDQNFEQFGIDEENKETITGLLLYFSGHPDFEKSIRIKNASLDKGILLAGNIGSGKTTLMRIMKELRISKTPFQTKNCRELAQLYATGGIEAIQRFGRKAVNYRNGQWKKQHFLFDDLGTEENMTYFGNQLNVMEQVLLDRSDHFVNHGLITHLTTNLDSEELKKTYGDRVMSRMNEMFNFIVLGGTKESKDRRIINQKTNDHDND